jgi:hypothetical protein
MSLLDFNESSPKSSGSRKPLKLILGISALVGTIALGATLAASINLNGGGPVEFGQGVTQTVACDDELIITPTSGFVNATGEGSFKFTGLTLSNLDTRSEGCAGKSLQLDAYGLGGSSLETISIAIESDGSFATEDGVLSNDGVQGAASYVTFMFSPPTINATSVYKITIQSEISTQLVASYSVGETGPGGGIVFYVSDSGFDCGPDLDASCNYLEAAPISGYNAWTDSGYQWDGNNNSVINSSMVIGSGLKNTLAMVQNDSTIAKAGTISRAFRGPNDFDDWFLPSYFELVEMFTQQTLLGLQTYPQYWSSSDDVMNGELAYIHAPDGGGLSYKTDGGRLVRPIRAF